jgi:uncharacterized membrane protein
LKTQDIAVIGVCAALYAIVGRLTAGVTFLGVGFLPAVVIPAVFATLYGPWVGGISGAVGIFIRDLLVHGNAALSLAAGVPPNFILFFLIGYIAHRNIDLKQAIAGVIVAAVGLLVPMIVFLPDFVATLGLSADFLLLISTITILPTLVIIAVVAIRWKEWRSYAISAVIGLAAGAGLLSVTVYAVSPLFLSYFGELYGASTIFPLFVWTFVTELPFILLAGPPIIKACYKAFPNLKFRTRTERKGGTIDQDR